MTNKKLCPIIKVTEALYKGGIYSAEDNNACTCNIDNVSYVFDDAPAIIGLEAFDSVRRGGKDESDSNAEIHETLEMLNGLRIVDHLHKLEARNSIRDLVKTGSAEVLCRDDIINKYTSGGKNLMSAEKMMRDRVNELTRRE